ncbi:MAG TPA: hypothetical protein DD727_08315 [Clostridiales bacterium]|nr:hypothetical protein [Clostridiales bacterium]
MSNENIFDGVHAVVPRERMSKGARKLRDMYELKPEAPLYMREFGFFSIDRWKNDGSFGSDPEKINVSKFLRENCGFDDAGFFALHGLGWTEAAFFPSFDVNVLEDRGDYEVVQDLAGRHVLYFKGRRNGFMPEYIDHPVKDMKTWEENCQWRLDPASPERYKDLEENAEKARSLAKDGLIITQRLIGGYMYLRSLMGPINLLYLLYDDPELIHSCMRTWLALADAVIERIQQYITLDELFLAEDICYNKGSLISPDMMREFLFPYYRQLIINVKKRQIDKNRHLYLNIDTDGYATTVIPLYQELGMDVMSPFEVASGCDVVEIGKRFPGLVMSGGIDKRILSQGKDAIDKHLDYILPAMYKRGGYYPTCDHGVPEEVGLDDYLYFRKRCLEYSF